MLNPRSVQSRIAAARNMCPPVYPVPGKLEKPKDKNWRIYVTYVVNASEVWCHLLGVNYSDQLVILNEEMDEFYEKNSESAKATNIKPGLYYSMKSENCWWRVKCLEYDSKTKEASVFYIDYGSVETCDADRLHNLDKQFCNLPGQALKLSLHGLEVFANEEATLYILREILLHRSFCVDVYSYHSKEDCTSAVIFYDSSDGHRYNVNVDCIASDLIDEFMPEPNIRNVIDVPRLVMCYVQHVTESGDVYLHLENDNMQILIDLMNEVILNKLSGDFTSLAGSRVNLLKLYMVKSHEDGNWYRASVTNINYTTNEVDVFLIDFGDTIRANFSSLVELESISEILALIPGRAIKVHLHNIPLSSFTEEKVFRLRDLAPPLLRLMARIPTISNINPIYYTSTPVIELLSRDESSNEIVNINNILCNS